MNSIDSIVKKRIEEDPALEIFDIEYEGKKLWIKRARKTSPRLVHHISYLFTKSPIVKPVEPKSAYEAMIFESSKLKELYDLSIPVPKVLEVTEEYFVIEDRGPSVDALIKKNLIDDPLAICEEIIIQLAILHNLGQFHGGALLRNCTYENGKIYFIDFEESFDKDMDIKDLQFRDMFMFLLSLSKRKVPVDYKALLNKYTEVSDNKEMMENFENLASQISFLIKIIENKTIQPMLGRDVTSVYRLLEELDIVPFQKNSDT